jgi:integrase
LPHLRRWKVADEKIGCTDVINFRGRAVCKVHQAWRAVAEDAGATQRDAPHIIRHTAATWQMQAGTDLYEAAGYLGMSPLTLWNVYGHNHPDFQSRAANAVPRRAKQEHAQESPGNPGHQRERTGNPDIHFP